MSTCSRLRPNWRFRNSRLSYSIVSLTWLSRRVLSGDKPDQALWFKYVDPDEQEGEHFEVYEHALEQVRALEVMA